MPAPVATRATHDATKKSFAEAPEVQQCHCVTGEVDFILPVVVRNGELRGHDPAAVFRQQERQAVQQLRGHGQGEGQLKVSSIQSATVASD